MSDSTAVVIAQFELDRRAFAELLTAFGVRVAALSDATAAGVTRLREHGPQLAVCVLDEADPRLAAALAQWRSAAGVRVIGIGQPAVCPDAWSGALDAYVARAGRIEDLRAAVSGAAGAPGRSHAGTAAPAAANGGTHANGGAANGMAGNGGAVNGGLANGVGHGAAVDLRQKYSKLTKTEAQLLPLLASGLTLRDAAKTLAISYKTADNSRTRLFRKLGLSDRVQLARFAIREGIITA